MKKIWKSAVLAVLIGMCAAGVTAQASENASLTYENEKPIPLWEDVNEMPYYDPEAHASNVGSVTPYLTGEKGGCVIICPGGGYVSYALEKEGEKIAEALNAQGINAFILRYRIQPYHYQAILSDVNRAVRFVRYYAEAFNINPHKVAIMGFSAGGHLAAMSMEHPGEDTEAVDEIDKMDAKPDFGVLCYPVITLLGEETHQTTKEAFLGPENVDNEALAEEYSAEKGVTADMPPCFIWHCKGDRAVPYKNSEMFAEAMEDAGVECKLQLYEYGNHGLGLAEDDEEIKNWFPDCVQWLKDGGILEAETVQTEAPKKAAQNGSGQEDAKAGESSMMTVIVAILAVVAVAFIAGALVIRSRKNKNNK